LAIGDVRLKLDPLLVEASPAVDGERIHVLRRAHVPAGGEDQPGTDERERGAGSAKEGDADKKSKTGLESFLGEVF